MGIIAICLVSIKGEIGCVVKNSFISYGIAAKSSYPVGISV